MRRVILLGTACLLASCEGPKTFPIDKVVIVGTTSVPSIRAGENVTITLTIYNPRDTDVRVALGGCQRPFDVLNIFGAVMGPRPAEICSLALIAPTLVPGGGSVTVETHWLGDSSQIGPADETVYVTPGTYFIRPKVQVVDEDLLFGQSIAIGIKPT